MKKLFKTNILNTRLGLFSLIAILLWLKNLFAYAVDFHLRLENINEYFILLINPIATTVFLLAIALYVRRKSFLYYNDDYLLLDEFTALLKCRVLSRIY